MNKKIISAILIIVIVGTGGIMLWNKIAVNNVFDEYYFVHVFPRHPAVISRYGIDKIKFNNGVRSINQPARDLGNDYITVSYRNEILPDHMRLYVMLNPDQREFEIHSKIYFQENPSEALSIMITYDLNTNNMVLIAINIISTEFRDDGNRMGAYSEEKISAFMGKYSISRETIAGYYQLCLDTIVEQWTMEGAGQFSMDHWGDYTVTDRIFIYFDQDQN